MGHYFLDTQYVCMVCTLYVEFLIQVENNRIRIKPLKKKPVPD